MVKRNRFTRLPSDGIFHRRLRRSHIDPASLQRLTKSSAQHEDARSLCCLEKDADAAHQLMVHIQGRASRRTFLVGLAFTCISSVTALNTCRHQHPCRITDMAPIRRYLRITKYSVLEVRIYLHKPSDAAWLLSSRDNVLPRIIEEVRPKVLPKLREENENAKKKSGKKKKGIKDVASQGRWTQS